jgi:predicted O-linked N-acetylglucosamine transferase (SPINDLY family)
VTNVPAANAAVPALVELERAMQLDPGNPEIAKSLGNAHKAAGDRDKAAEWYRQALRIAPDHLPSLYNLGLVLHEMNRLEEAERAFDRARQLAPKDVEVLAHLGAILCKRARHTEAAATLRAALQLAPEDAKLWLWLAVACEGDHDGIVESIQCLRRCLAIDPAFAEAQAQLGAAYRKLGRLRMAEDAFRRALALDARLTGAIDGLGGLLLDAGRLDEAVAHYRGALLSSPDAATHFNGLGCALTRRGALAEALVCYRKAIDLQPDYAGAYHNLGTALSLQGEREQALHCFEEALRLEPGDAIVRECLLHEKQGVCDWSRLDELVDLQRASLREPAGPPVSPFALLSIASTAREQLQCAARFSAMQARSVREDREHLAFRFDRGPRERLTVGYLSADFHEHATAYLTAELFELHDRSSFRVFGYSYGPDDRSAMRARLRGAFDRFVDLAGLSHADAASAIHADDVDILVDLKGHTTNARTEILALRPAPIQVNYLGYPGTMGADFIDYLIGDRIVTPAAQARDFTEKLVLMPGSYQVNDRRRPAGDAPARSSLGLPDGAIVFCCFNQAYKILPEVFGVWMRLLLAAPDSVLWLLDWNPAFKRNLRREAGERGVHPDRLVFAPVLPLAEHLRRLSAADLFLDTQPYNAHTTASDALWAGLPILTCAGTTFASRVAASLLCAAGMPELVTHSMADYEAVALRLIRSPQNLLVLRERLVRSRHSSALFDTPKFARFLEQAYARMWAQYRAGDGAQAFSVDAAAGSEPRQN